MQWLQTITIIYFAYELAILSIATTKSVGVADLCSLLCQVAGWRRDQLEVERPTLNLSEKSVLAAQPG